MTEALVQTALHPSQSQGGDFSPIRLFEPNADFLSEFFESLPPELLLFVQQTERLPNHLAGGRVHPAANSFMHQLFQFGCQGYVHKTDSLIQTINKSLA
ncbi:MAG: hypothetical protein A3H27_00290 [Acidobacteria bacterium RIFCSPLOWO2_02_FULL_59_13]|nr:MAG: hypothetical protein A3H27_00290 [Acidobacteria bacterium RIFCSPLOWO2_02_FULL_59_13]